MARSLWERERGGRTYYVQITPAQVLSGCRGERGMDDEGSACTRKEFLAGRLQDVVRADLGADVLAQVLAELGG